LSCQQLIGINSKEIQSSYMSQAVAISLNDNDQYQQLVIHIFLA